MKTLELLAPARNYRSAVAAVDAGADALYIGGARFGARRAAGNDIEEIARVAEYARQYGVRVHATLNTLLYDDELEAARQQACELIEAGVDALIVQDMALRRMELPVELHASTQMCNMTPEQAVFLARTGFARVILERALPIDEIRAIAAATTAEVECFVHGAICVGYSGRCFLSRSMGERSGNRGACSQPCRLTYDLVDGRGTTILRGRHLLSVRDLNLSARLGELIDAGVTSFKIEGRLKDENYVRNVVSFYRAALDREIAARQGFRRASAGESRPDFRPDPAKSFTRGESEYFFDGRRAGVASFDTPKSVGEFIGRAVRCDGRGFTLDRNAQLAPGDGLCFVGSRGMTGLQVNGVEGRRVVPNRMEAMAPGTEIYRNFDSRFNRTLSRSRMRRTIAVSAAVEISAAAIRIGFRDCEGVEACVERTGAFEPPREPGRMAEAIREQLMRSGDTIFEVREVALSGEVRFVPVSLLAALRREGLAQLRANRMAAHRRPEPRPEECGARYPATALTAEENVTNRLAEAFYRDHGVTEIERGLDLAPSTVGRRVMRSAYCIRREIGACLLRQPKLRGDLFLVHGDRRYRLAFDCARCEMSLIDESGAPNL